MSQVEEEEPGRPTRKKSPGVHEEKISSPVHLQEQLGEGTQDTDGEEAGNTGSPVDAAELKDETEEQIKPVHFGQLEAGIPREGSNLNRLNNVWVTVIVEFGRKEMTVRELLQLKEQEVIELDKLPGEPLDLLVNGQLVARGEIVVLNDTFAFRITDLIED